MYLWRKHRDSGELQGRVVHESSQENVPQPFVQGQPIASNKIAHYEERAGLSCSRNAQCTGSSLKQTHHNFKSRNTVQQDEHERWKDR